MDETTRQTLTQKYYLDRIDEAQAALERLRAAVAAEPFDVDAKRQMIREQLAEAEDMEICMGGNILLDQIQAYRHLVLELRPWASSTISAVIDGEVIEGFTVAAAEELRRRMKGGDLSPLALTP